MHEFGTLFQKIDHISKTCKVKKEIIIRLRQVQYVSYIISSQLVFRSAINYEVCGQI